MEKISSIIKEITRLEKDFLGEQERLLHGALSILEKNKKQGSQNYQVSTRYSC